MSFIGGHALGEGSRTGRSQEAEGSPHREVRVGVDPELVQHLSHKEAFFFFFNLVSHWLWVAHTGAGHGPLPG